MEILEETKELETKTFKNIEEAKHYTHNLSERLHEEENKLMQKKRELDDMIWELRHAESKVFDYYLSIGNDYYTFGGENNE